MKIVSQLLKFIANYFNQFILLLLMIAIEGLLTALSVISIIPLSQYLLDPNLVKPHEVTRLLLEVFNSVQIEGNFKSFGYFFVMINIFKSLFEVFVSYAIHKIKFTVQEDLIKSTLQNFFYASWSFFTKNDNTKLLNIIHQEISHIGDMIAMMARFIANLFQLVIYLSVPFFINAELTTLATIMAILLAVPLRHTLNLDCVKD
jgi:ABC-type multidrug transport system fused ATPase/permease subunit